MAGADWIDDITVQTTKQLTTTGGTVWNAARRCAGYLEHEATIIGLDRPGVRVLELGAGCGLLGLLVARNTPAAHLPHMASVTTCACSDLVYNSAGVMGFPRVLAALTQPPNSTTEQQQPQQQQQQQQQTVMYYAHTKHRFDAMDVDLFEQLQRLGLCVAEVVEAGQELPPASPPPFSSLYPEMRCAVFRISRPAAAGDEDAA
ncbi:hypothetical protein OEZ85_007768 [Tetradesmus obliquus]|uniref:Methyltransferase small domain-containing protein n=1 Tax=Tetradesmus obliquus TaxID=3088 RepID=A0ABY8TKG8_TETOB|nr:hypothetical protein OEZ85_007768 [Tetradesmus obliquus]